MPPRPSFRDLPCRPGDPPFSAWGLYGAEDQLGALNLLTPETTLAAARSEIQTGVRIPLDPPIDCLLTPASGRAGLKHTIARRGEDRAVHDDTVEFNTQIGPQWDGFRHVAYLKAKLFYNNTPLERISGANPDPEWLGTQAWVQNGSIVGRGVLLDFHSYAQAKGIEYERTGPKADYPISLAELKDVAATQGVQIRHGDILFVRSGFWSAYHQLSGQEKRDWSAMEPPIWVGVETTANLAEFLWNSGIAACAGDAPGWERIPNYNSPAEAGLKGLSLHEIMLGGWGMPIGEMFDLEALSEECKRQGRWSFFVTSAPLHVRGGVGSPPNAIAIF
ncbi:hypothetical protein LTR10_024205 [Elasticomyces elasticus]|uniref:Cyclase n=1 Tax=Exophiala sideris TaxID=1016849 RepID=A0ABR0IUP0_9EURO|nr:hypothetical protein LTR10_024205 [Elasticomyces elasticus]KAK5021098.1 hypothetical protein LTS07_011251 [Exophiala sideris]KAK5022852.1 hypothetical protein LTR13_011393 [Exophiala sideris]KAK5048795.1 hypothetical protein LTR69_011258 [Exophiala sideris]KAK5176268.1 hypothetical protein LTR44_011199 [Eurotiomycetes sp. CCFEE 6388]